MTPKKVLLSAFQCDKHGVSEAFVGFKWVEQIARYYDVFLLSSQIASNLPTNVKLYQSGRSFKFENKPLEGLNKAIKLDYFLYDAQCFIRHKKLLNCTQIFHHITPIAPRYPSLLGLISEKFVIGPIGGGLRVPKPFSKIVEKREPIYFKLRDADRLRLKYDPLLTRTYRNASVILVAGKYMFDIIPEQYHSKMRTLLETGISPEDYKQYSFRERQNDKINILYVGRIVPYKGLEFLLRAIGKLPSKYLTKIHLHILGEGTKLYEHRCKNICSEIGIDREVTFYGLVSKKDVLNWYKKVDLVCLPTLAETSGNVILEAMATGVPVMAINYGGPSEILNERTGFLIDPISPEFVEERMADILKELIANPEILPKIGSEGRKRAFSEFSWEKKGNIINLIYDELID